LHGARTGRVNISQQTNSNDSTNTAQYQSFCGQAILHYKPDTSAPPKLPGMMHGRRERFKLRSAMMMDAGASN